MLIAETTSKIRRAYVVRKKPIDLAWNQRHFAAEFAAMRTRLGLAEDVHFHGLRHTRTSRVSEAGASEAQVQAITGHKTRQMVERYTRGANQKKLVKSAIAHFPRKRIGNSE